MHFRFVLRCSAHSVQSAVGAGFSADPVASELSKSVAGEVAKFVRSSPRFAARLSEKQREATVAALTNFSFAPQRFASKERPLSRITVFAEHVVEAACPPCAL